MARRNKSLATAEEFFRLLGQANLQPSAAHDTELARFMVANSDWFVEMFLNLPTTVGNNLKLYKWRDKYLRSGAARDDGTVAT